LKELHLMGVTSYYIKKELFKDAYTSVIGFQGPLYQGNKQTRNKFRIDAGKRTGTIKTPEWRLVSSEYPETGERFLVQIMDEQEILVEKICSLMKRHKGRDLYDVWLLLEKGVDVDEELLHKKMEKHGLFSKALNKPILPSQREYERDIGKLTSRIIPYAQGIGFAIPINMVKECVEQIRIHGRSRTPWVGIYGVSLTPQVASYYNLRSDKGALVTNVVPGSPAQKAAIESGDIIVAFDGADIAGVEDLKKEIIRRKVGETVRISVVRGAQKRIVELTIEEAP